MIETNRASGADAERDHTIDNSPRKDESIQVFSQRHIPRGAEGDHEGHPDDQEQNARDRIEVRKVIDAPEERSRKEGRDAIQRNEDPGKAQRGDDQIPIGDRIGNRRLRAITEGFFTYSGFCHQLPGANSPGSLE